MIRKTRALPRDEKYKRTLLSQNVVSEEYVCILAHGASISTAEI